MLGIAAKIGGKILKGVATKVANKMPGKKPLGQLFKKLVGSGDVQPVGQIVSKTVKEETAGQIDLSSLKRQDNETKDEHVSRITSAASNAGVTFMQQVEKPTSETDPAKAAERGAKKAVFRKYGIIAGVVVIVILVVVAIFKRK